MFEKCAATSNNENQQNTTTMNCMSMHVICHRNEAAEMKRITQKSALIKVAPFHISMPLFPVALFSLCVCDQNERRISTDRQTGLKQASARANKL